MNVLFVASEVAPFAKAGGLGDVAAALPRALAGNAENPGGGAPEGGRDEGRGRGGSDARHDVRVVMPLYARVAKGLPAGATLTPVIGDVVLTLGGRRITFSVVATELPGSNVPVYFVKCHALYGRPSIYTQDGDEHLRFAVLSWAALVICQRLGFAPDIVHVNDWQTSLVPLLLKTVFAWDRLFSRTRTVLTIHNIGHQGTFDAKVVGEIGLGDAAGYFHQDQLREGRVNFLLTGIMYANAITTVSPTYAREIMTPQHGVGLDWALRERRDVVFGVLNGIDEGEWSPENDAKIPQRYGIDSLELKEENKKALLRDAGLPYVHEAPVIGIVSRLAWQKGFDLCFEVLPRMLARRAVQLVVLGTGEPQYEEFFGKLARRFPRQVAYLRAFSEPLAHTIEAGADMFLMPSRYEPCGLNQMYSLRYGTPPIVHRTGGLADTVAPCHAAPGADGEWRVRGNGFVFDHFDAGGLAYALGRALEVWGSGTGADRARWRRLQENGMRARFSWTERVTAYEQLYRWVAPGR